MSVGIPIIDISAVLEGQTLDSVEALKICQQIDHASTLTGFYYIVNHGIPLDDAIAQSKEFFKLSTEIKESLKKQTPYRGYYGMTEKTKNNLDLKEGFDYSAFDTREGHTIWPEGYSQIKDGLLGYYENSRRLSKRLFEVYAHNLGVPKDYFTQFFPDSEHLSYARLNYYPVTEKEGFGVWGHQDGDAITILKPDDDVVGLQIYMDDAWDEFSSDESKWVTIQPLKDALVVNVGTMLEVWSNKRYKAALHRALAMPEVERFSTVFFLLSFSTK